MAELLEVDVAAPRVEVSSAGDSSIVVLRKEQDGKAYSLTYGVEGVPPVDEIEENFDGLWEEKYQDAIGAPLRLVQAQLDANDSTLCDLYEAILGGTE